MTPPHIPSRQELLARGRAIRKKLPRRQLGHFSTEDRDIVSIISQSNEGRLTDLVPLRMARMAQSPFAFFRGVPQLMAADICPAEVTGIQAQICGDAHLQNLGVFGTQHGHLIFDLNDFDETTTGPWEWDIKRLAASIVLAGRESDHKDHESMRAIQAMARRYSETVNDISCLPVRRLADFSLLRTSGSGPIQRILRKGQSKTPTQQMRKSTLIDAAGTPRFRQLPLQHEVPELEARFVLESLSEYRETLTINHQIIFDSYLPADVCFKVVGTNSVGTRDYVVMLFGNGLRDPLFLQIKEALPSVYASYLPGIVQPSHHGQRVAQGQQRIQIVSDPFLGWTTIESRYFLVRKLAERKANIKPGYLRGQALTQYALACGESIAKAHTRTGDGFALAGYLGSSSRFGETLAIFARRYADRMEQNYREFLRATETGALPIADDPLL